MVDKKILYEEELAKIKSIFKDVNNLEIVLVLYKASATCLYFKSLYKSGRNLNILNELLKITMDFGNDLDYQEEINIIQFQNKNLLISDGKYIRFVCLSKILPSINFQLSIRKVIRNFEENFFESKWKNIIVLFNNIGQFIEDFLNISINLAYGISFEMDNLDEVINAQSKDIFTIASNLLKSSKRNFFFIKTLLKEVYGKTERSLSEILQTIKELKKKKIFIPLNVSKLEDIDVSNNQVKQIEKYLSFLNNITSKEKEILKDLLIQKPIHERAVYLYSFINQKKIVSAPLMKKKGDKNIEDIKMAKKEISNLKKLANALFKDHDYLNSIDYITKCLKIATDLKIKDGNDELFNLIRLASLEYKKSKIQNLTAYAKTAVLQDNVRQASINYELAYKIAIEIFDLGIIDAVDDIKRFVNNSLRYKK